MHGPCQSSARATGAENRVIVVADATIVAPWASRSVALPSLTAGNGCASDNESDESTVTALQVRDVQIA